MLKPLIFCALASTGWMLAQEPLKAPPPTQLQLPDIKLTPVQALPQYQVQFPKLNQLSQSPSPEELKSLALNRLKLSDSNRNSCAEPLTTVHGDIRVDPKMRVGLQAPEPGILPDRMSVPAMPVCKH